MSEEEEKRKKLVALYTTDLDYLERKTKNSTAFIRELVHQAVKKLQERTKEKSEEILEWDFKG